MKRVRIAVTPGQLRLEKGAVSPLPRLACAFIALQSADLHVLAGDAAAAAAAYQTSGNVRHSWTVVTCPSTSKARCTSGWLCVFDRCVGSF